MRIGGTRGEPSVHHSVPLLSHTVSARSGAPSISESCSGDASCSRAARPAASQRSSQTSSAAIAQPTAAGRRRSAGSSARPCQRFGSITPRTARSPQIPPAVKRQTGAPRKAATLRPSSPATGQNRCSQSSQRSVKSRGRPAHEIFARRHLAVEAKRDDRRRGGHIAGHLKSRSTPGANGFSTDPARISNEALRSPTWKLSV